MKSLLIIFLIVHYVSTGYSQNSSIKVNPDGSHSVIHHKNNFSERKEEIKRKKQEERKIKKEKRKAKRKERRKKRKNN